MPGHVNPTLAVARELTRRGHEVLYHLPESYGRQVRETGAGLHPIRVAPPERYADPLTRFAMFPVWLAKAAESVLPEVIDRLGDTRPDVILYDQTCVWGRLLSKIMPGPAAQFVPTYVSNEHFSLMNSPRYAPIRERLAPAFAEIVPPLDRLNRTFGLTARPHELFARDEELVLVIMPRAFHPAGETFGAPFVFVGSSIDLAAPADRRLLERIAPGRRVVYISFGTVMSLSPELVDTVCKAFADDVWQVVLSLGDYTPALTLPGNVIAAPSVPQLDVLRAADAFVTHGGVNSAVESIAAEVPMVVLPLTPEHAVTADQVAALGLGTRLDASGTTPEALREAVDHVARSASIRRAVSGMRRALEVDGGYRAAADALAAVAGDRS